MAAKPLKYWTRTPEKKSGVQREPTEPATAPRWRKASPGRPDKRRERRRSSWNQEVTFGWWLGPAVHQAEQGSACERATSARLTTSLLLMFIALGVVMSIL